MTKLCCPVPVPKLPFLSLPITPATTLRLPRLCFLKLCTGLSSSHFHTLSSVIWTSFCQSPPPETSLFKNCAAKPGPLSQQQASGPCSNSLYSPDFKSWSQIKLHLPHLPFATSGQILPILPRKVSCMWTLLFFFYICPLILWVWFSFTRKYFF